MLQVGSQVMYGIHGVCNVIGTEMRTIDRKSVEYLILEPNDQPGACFYVPAHNPVALSKLHPLIAKEEMEMLLESVEGNQANWITSENLRKQKYKELINNVDRAEIIGMIRLLHDHKAAQLAAGRKFHLCDENFLRDARKLLASECVVVLGLSRNEVTDYLNIKLMK